MKHGITNALVCALGQVSNSKIECDMNEMITNMVDNLLTN